MEQSQVIFHKYVFCLKFYLVFSKNLQIMLQINIYPLKWTVPILLETASYYHNSFLKI